MVAWRQPDRQAAEARSASRFKNHRDKTQKAARANLSTESPRSSTTHWTVLLRPLWTSIPGAAKTTFVQQVAKAAQVRAVENNRAAWVGGARATRQHRVETSLDRLRPLCGRRRSRGLAHGGERAHRAAPMRRSQLIAPTKPRDTALALSGARSSDESCSTFEHRATRTSRLMGPVRLLGPARTTWQHGGSAELAIAMKSLRHWRITSHRRLHSSQHTMVP